MWEWGMEDKVEPVYRSRVIRNKWKHLLFSAHVIFAQPFFMLLLLCLCLCISWCILHSRRDDLATTWLASFGCWQWAVEPFEMSPIGFVAVVDAVCGHTWCTDACSDNEAHAFYDSICSIVRSSSSRLSLFLWSFHPMWIITTATIIRFPSTRSTPRLSVAKQTINRQLYIVCNSTVRIWIWIHFIGN